MRRFSAPVLFLLGLLAVAAVAGATFGLASVAGIGDDDVATADGGDGGVDEPVITATTGGVGLAASQVEVTGLATTVNVENIQTFGPLDLPLTVTTPERGLGAGARLEGVAVDGQDALVTWDAGRPFVLGPAGGLLELGFANVYMGPGTCVIGFPERAVHGFAPGPYDLATPVAVSHGAGLGESRESVAFVATAASTVSFTGGASTAIPLAERDLSGPGRVVLAGEFTVRHPDGTTTEATSVELPAGPFELHVIPLLGGGGWDVRALLQGEVAAS